jgi:hypothetical protein
MFLYKSIRILYMNIYVNRNKNMGMDMNLTVNLDTDTDTYTDIDLGIDTEPDIVIRYRHGHGQRQGHEHGRPSMLQYAVCVEKEGETHYSIWRGGANAPLVRIYTLSVK